MREAQESKSKTQDLAHRAAMWLTIVAVGCGAATFVSPGYLADVGIVPPIDVNRLSTLARATYGKMVLNLAWATGYNLVAIPLAAGVLAGFGVLLSPAIGRVFMSASTIVVAINARTLRIRS